jgi:hypothetical protein
MNLSLSGRALRSTTRNGRSAATEDDLRRAIVEELRRVLTDEHRTLLLWALAEPPPLAVIGRGRVHLVFPSSGGSDLSEPEEELRAWCAVGATPYCVARSLDDLRVALEHWRIPLRAGA